VEASRIDLSLANFLISLLFSADSLYLLVFRFFWIYLFGMASTSQNSSEIERDELDSMSGKLETIKLEEHSTENSELVTSSSPSNPQGFVDPSNFSVKHPLQNRWTLWFDAPPQGAKLNQANWGDTLKEVVTFDTVEDFWRIFNNIRPASKLQNNANYSLFKDNIQPKWESPDNKQGGKWIVNSKSGKDNLDKMWLWSVLACIGETFEDENEICGCVVSLRSRGDKIALWTRTSGESVQRRVGAQWKRALELPDTSVLGFTVHSDSIKRGASYNNKNRYEV